MGLQQTNQPAVPIAYALLILELASECGVTREAMLANSNIPADILDKPDARLSLEAAGELLLRAILLSKDQAFGYAIGLRSNITSHGFLGYGLMSYPTLREAIAFGAKFLQLRLPILNLSVITESDEAALIVTETAPLGELRQCIFDLFLVGLWRMMPTLTVSQLNTGVELWFDYPQPDYYEHYCDRLPVMRFSMPSNQIHFPASYLDRPIKTANPVTAKLVTDQCAKELSFLGFTENFLAQVRAILNHEQGAYPDQETLAAQLHMSGRTLKRKLQQHGVSFQSLLDETRKRDAMALLQNSALSIEEVAARIGYTDRANFTRAFRKWTGFPPTECRSNKRNLSNSLLQNK
jgi:AraC-like DNA-binding protein